LDKKYPKQLWNEKIKWVSTTLQKWVEEAWSELLTKPEKLQPTFDEIEKYINTSLEERGIWTYKWKQFHNRKSKNTCQQFIRSGYLSLLWKQSKNRQ
jgi:uncharacterized protein YbdZ (MbtH family)